MGREPLEQTLVLIKPDALKNSLTGYVLSQLSEFHTGLRFAGAKIVHVSRMLAEEHYAEHRGKVFFPSIIDYIVGSAGLLRSSTRARTRCRKHETSPDRRILTRPARRSRDASALWAPWFLSRMQRETSSVTGWII